MSGKKPTKKEQLALQEIEALERGLGQELTRLDGLEKTLSQASMAIAQERHTRGLTYLCDLLRQGVWRSQLVASEAGARVEIDPFCEAAKTAHKKIREFFYCKNFMERQSYAIHIASKDTPTRLFLLNIGWDAQLSVATELAPGAGSVVLMAFYRPEKEKISLSRSLEEWSLQRNELERQITVSEKKIDYANRCVKLLTSLAMLEGAIDPSQENPWVETETQRRLLLLSVLSNLVRPFKLKDPITFEAFVRRYFSADIAQALLPTTVTGTLDLSDAQTCRTVIVAILLNLGFDVGEKGERGTLLRTAEGWKAVAHGPHCIEEIVFTEDPNESGKRFIAGLSPDASLEDAVRAIATHLANGDE